MMALVRLLVGSALGVALAACLCACAGSSVLHPAGGRYDGPLHLSANAATHPRAGAAGEFVECRDWGAGGFFREKIYVEGATSRSAEGALKTATNEGGFLGPTEPLEMARRDDRVLFVTEVDGVPKQAVIVHDGPAAEGTGGDGWYVESWAVCDYSELPRSFTDAIGLQVWYDDAGRPAPTEQIQSWVGPEHCDWQSMTLLTLGDKDTYWRNPEEGLREYLVADYAASVPLPADAVDTGFVREGQHLWTSSDGRFAFVGSSAASVEAWPRESEPIRCA